MNQNDRFRVLNKIRYSTVMTKKCQVCGSKDNVHVIINEDNHDLIKFICASCKYEKDEHLKDIIFEKIDKAPYLNINDYVVLGVAKIRLSNLKYHPEIELYIEDALATELTQTQWLKSKGITKQRFDKFLDLYEEHTRNYDVRKSLKAKFSRISKNVKLKTLNKIKENERNNINKFRLEQDLSLQDLSLKIDLALTKESIYYIANGNYTPKKHSMILISKALNKKPIEVFPNDWTEEE